MNPDPAFGYEAWVPVSGHWRSTAWCPLESVSKVRTSHSPPRDGNFYQAVEDVTRNPQIGERKKGDLAALRVHKFHSGGLLYLLGYTLDEGVRLIYLEAVGPHENFYRDLKR